MTAERTRLPAEFSSFVGRAGEVADLAELVRSARAVTLCGAGGIGKTRLALRLVAAIADTFPDGVWFVDLGELRQPGFVPAAVASVVGVDEEPGRPLTDTLADAVRHRQALLVLDNCEHLVRECASLCQRLLAGAPELRVLATSREPLHVAAETVWQVPPLAQPPPAETDWAAIGDFDAVRLFTERAAAASPGFGIRRANAASIARICRALDGLPLAIELAAAWTRVLSADQIADRLADRFRLLTGADRAAPARHQTLRATLDWSFGLLSPPEQVLLRRLSVFAEWSLDMAEQVCADHLLPARDILDLVTALTDKSLLEIEPEMLGQARYRMLESVRDYAAGCLIVAGEAAEFARRRREYTVRECEHLVALGMAVVAGPWSARVDVFRRVDAEAANLREVLSECRTLGDAETGLRLCSAIRPVWIVRGAFAEGARWFDAFLALPAAAAAPDAVRGPALAGRAQLALASGSPGAAELALTALELCWAAGNQFEAAAALNLLTEIALHAGQLDEAWARGSEALAVARSEGDRWNEGYALGTMAAVAGFRGNLRAAEELGAEALAVMRAIEQLWGAARALLGLGDLARVKADYETAGARYREALGILRELHARPDLARCLAGLGRLAIELGDPVTARADLSESLRLSYTAGSRTGVARGLEALARLALLEGQPETALRLAGAMTALRAGAGLPPLPGARTQRYLDAAAPLGQHAIGRLWAEGAALTSAEAVRLALGEPAPEPLRAETLVGEQSTVAAEPDPPAAGTGVPGGAAQLVSSPAPAVPESLTAREREVVALIAAGKSNRAIGAELFISPATAARHVANILAKLGFTSRSQVAVWAASRAGQPEPKSADTDSPS
jgi:predicted ATPase/DNA-binding CsgD family transcriptional regulator